MSVDEAVEPARRSGERDQLRRRTEMTDMGIGIADATGGYYIDASLRAAQANLLLAANISRSGDALRDADQLDRQALQIVVDSPRDPPHPA